MTKVYKVVLLLILISNWAFSQHTFSPYTVFGIGDLQSRSMSHQFAMGDVGIAAPSFYHINNMNPALLTSNVFSVFELGLQGESINAESGVDNMSSGTGGFKYLSFAFPIVHNTWTTNIGARPYSLVNYNFVTGGAIEGNSEATSVTQRQGEGGLTEFYWSNGVKVQNLSLGIRASFLFGFIEDKETVSLEGDDITSQIPAGTYEKTNYKGYNFGFGAAYMFKLDERKSIHVGATYDMAKSLEGSRVVRQVATVNGSFEIVGDTLNNLSYDGAFDIPAEIGLGVSYEYINKFILSVDVKTKQWEKKAGFLEGSSQTYRSTLEAGIGLEFIPKYNDVNSYLNRIRYRFGFHYEQLPYSLGEDVYIDDYNFSFGWSLPVKSVSALNMAFKFGQRGTKSEGLVQERYVKFVLGVTLNDRWFVRRKYN
ncbi:MAG: hypothetical protein OCD76_11740 [Reichenbachiella sp.]